MSISVMDLQAGDRVVLNCPKARSETKREAQFEGIFHGSISEVMKRRGGTDVLITGPETAAFLLSGETWARFLLQRVSGVSEVLEYPGGGAIGLPPFDGMTDLVVAFLIEPDGGLREEKGRRVFIERRLRMGQG